MSGGHRADSPRTVLARAMAILECFSTERPSLRLVEISRRTGLPISTVLRLVGQLCDCGAVERTTDLHYRIGARLGRLAELHGAGPATPVGCSVREARVPDRPLADGPAARSRGGG